MRSRPVAVSKKFIVVSTKPVEGKANQYCVRTFTPNKRTAHEDLRKVKEVIWQVAAADIDGLLTFDCVQSLLADHSGKKLERKWNKAIGDVSSFMNLCQASS